MLDLYSFRQSKNVAVYLLILLLTRLCSSKQQKGDTCSGSVNYMDRPFYESFPKLLTNFTLLQQLYGPQDKKFKSESAQIFYINSSTPKQQFIMCLTPKSGSTRYKLLLYRILNKDFKLKNAGKLDLGWRVYNPLQSLPEKEVESVLKNKNIPRFQIVRNPYIRAISMFESKILANNSMVKMYKKGLFYPEDKEMSFEQFIESVYNIYVQRSTNVQGYNYINKHFQPQTKLCKMHIGMSYNYYLKMDKMNDWYDCFVDMVNIRDEVLSGWPGKNNCYFSTPKNPCNGPSHEEPAQADSGRFRFSSAGYDFERIGNYYKNSTIVQMVNLIYASDFFTYDYQMMTME